MKYSLKPSDKLKLKSDFTYVREHGKKYVSRYCLLVTASSPDERLRCGIICGKKFNRKAVSRNRARRLLWESFRLLKPRIAKCHMSLIARQQLSGRKQQEVQAALEGLLKEANLLTD